MNEKMQASSKVGAGKTIMNRHERFFKRGSLMFIEGESSTEMFIIKSGLVRILKQEGENTVELAQLGGGCVLGELSLLDHQPRSATAQVLEDTLVTIIDEELFARTLKSIPTWLGNIVQLVVKRLRDTMKKTGEDIVRKSIAGVIQVLLLMRATVKETDEASKNLFVKEIGIRVLAVTGLGRLELESVFLHLILKGFILIKKDISNSEYVIIKEPDALRLYMHYLRMHQHRGMLAGESLSEKAVELIKAILDTSRRHGATMATKLSKIGVQQLEIELEKSGMGRYIDRDALDELVSSKLIMYQDEKIISKHGHHTRKVLHFNPDLLESVLMLKKWLPLFVEEIRSETT